jgi:hypothetical protein
MQSMQINKPYYKHEIPSDIDYQEVVKAAKEYVKQSRIAAKETKQQEREANKLYDEATAYYRNLFLEEACLAPEEIIENIASSAYTNNPKTNEPYNSFLVRMNYEEDYLDEVDGKALYKNEILKSSAFQIAVKKYYRKYDCTGVRFTFLKDKPILVMTIFLEKKENKKAIKEKKIEIAKPSNVYSLLDDEADKNDETFDTEETDEIMMPMNLKGAWAK